MSRQGQCCCCKKTTDNKNRYGYECISCYSIRLEIWKELKKDYSIKQEIENEIQQKA